MKAVLACLVALLLGMISACSEVGLVDVSLDPDHMQLIGEQYEIVGAVDAYGIRPHSKAEVEYITLIPPPGIGGNEVGFKIRLRSGSRITIVKVMETNRWLDCGVAFIVTVEGTSMPIAAMTRIEMNRGNESDGCLDLNPEIYRNVMTPSTSAGFE